MEGLAEALELIQTTAVTAAGVEVTAPPQLPHKLIIAQGGEHVIMDAEPPVRDHDLRSLDDLVRLATTDGVPVARSLWHSPEAVKLVFDNSDRRDLATFDLEPTKVWKWLATVDTPAGMVNQKQFLALLRIRLCESINEEQRVELQTNLGAVKFSNTDETAQDLTQRGREGLGHSLERECTGADKLPEFFTVVTEVYGNVTLGRATVRVAIDINFDKQAFRLSTMAEDFSRAMDAAQRELGNQIRTKLQPSKEVADKIGVFYGTP